MAKNSCTLNLQDFIPYPVQVLPLREFLPRDNHLLNNHSNNNNNNDRSTTCPFDCCQKQFQSQYFPNCELTNAPLRMKIGTAGDRHNKVSGIPCLERRTIFEGRVTEMPMRYEDLLNESSTKPRSTLNSGHSDLLLDNDHPGSLIINKTTQQQQQSQKQQQQLLLGDPGDKLKLTFHKGGGGGKPLSMPLNLDKSQEKSGQYKYLWESERGGWTFENKGPGNRSGCSTDKIATIGDQKPVSVPVSLEDQWRHYHQQQGEMRDRRWAQSQINKVIAAQQHQERQRHVIIADNPQSLKSDNPQAMRLDNPQNTRSDLKSEFSPRGKNEFIEQQLSCHLKSFRYIKPAATTQNNSPVGSSSSTNTSNSVPISPNYKSLNSQSRPNFKSKHPDNSVKGALSPRAALEQYERLRKYWDYQHQLLGTSLVPYHPKQGPLPHPIQQQQQIQQQQFQQQEYYNTNIQKLTQQAQDIVAYSHDPYGSPWPGGYTGTGRTTLTDAKCTPSDGYAQQKQQQQQYQPAGPYFHNQGWSSGLEFSRPASSNESQTAQNSQNHQQSIRRTAGSLEATLGRIKAIKAAAAVVENPRMELDVDVDESDDKPKNSKYRRGDEDDEASNQSSHSASSRHSRNSTNAETNSRSSTKPKDSDEKDEEKSSTEVDMEEREEKSPTDLSTSGRRDSDRSSLSASPPDRSVVAGLVEDYDHIVLLDKRVKTYMCKRCFETLKSEQEIRNHLFCKMLNDTISCHICKNLFSAHDYPQHLKIHALKNQ